jgi:hypothetical protein
VPLVPPDPLTFEVYERPVSTPAADVAKTEPGAPAPERTPAGITLSGRVPVTRSEAEPDVAIAAGRLPLILDTVSTFEPLELVASPEKAGSLAVGR